ncbi:uncharacterized protein MYCFIDRAFT_173503 [Pseudocercospora fijiensis CIRAD86]|uniref:Uncharacterized protein n=1 Tax=Pseudocercospora fijiensis (strain CIRAD86) TaxID=383855 RepID=M3B597_PSEFD|nr:uncharacterized protein MYCFIDRAFT_173503 [Pseudocercospora fijiensis CIRAD86]EME84532.1 hypothetical protein MYCFIDRAFT_173503 [Pseudocercospora fijiensis CIRAD86]
MVQQLTDLEDGFIGGTTTQDLTDTATILHLRDTIKLIEKVLNGIIAALVKLCQKHPHRSTPMAARSNLQQAVYSQEHRSLSGGIDGQWLKSGPLLCG